VSSATTKTGVDDFLAGGGTVAELLLMARPFERQDLGRERLSQDDNLRGAIEGLWQRWRAQTWCTRGDYSARSIFRALLSRAERSGRTVAGGVQVEAAKRPLAEEAAVSDRAVTRAIPRLEEMGMLRRDNEGRRRDAAGRFVLLTDSHEVARYCPHNGERGTGGEARLKAEGFSELFTGPSNRGGDTNALVPELRFSTIRFYREQDKHGRWERRGHYVARLEKKRGRIVEVLVGVGGEATLAELVEELGSKSEKKRPWDFRRRTLGPLVDAGIITVEAEAVRLTEQWREALQDARELTEEIRDARLQAQMHRRASAAYRAREANAADTVPAMTPIPDMRSPWPAHPDGCACPSCEEKYGRVIGEHVEGCCCATCFTTRKVENGGRVVALLRRTSSPGDKPAAAPLASVAVLHEATAEDSLDDWRSHPLECECHTCMSPITSYATPWCAS
jgi:DNA-binding transcriptional ArsR family regulator